MVDMLEQIRLRYGPAISEKFSQQIECVSERYNMERLPLLGVGNRGAVFALDEQRAVKIFLDPADVLSESHWLEFYQGKDFVPELFAAHPQHIVIERLSPERYDYCDVPSQHERMLETISQYEDVDDGQSFEQWMMGGLSWDMQRNEQLKMFKPAEERFVHEMAKNYFENKQTLIHADMSRSNVLSKAKRPVLIDPRGYYVGDPYSDLAKWMIGYDDGRQIKLVGRQLRALGADYERLLIWSAILAYDDALHIQLLAVEDSSIVQRYVQWVKHIICWL